eukprot:TRINITY_DN31179_c0_g1_i1.p1 TRINITY_DN31179_c0_g1~~TRINITY_DN31179_c0_g1_i1.p1  ORF type:complete len:157 (+),score=0.76 TRINITY_DN31179_c0_g1_i1:53-523(+)
MHELQQIRACNSDFANRIFTTTHSSPIQNSGSHNQQTLMGGDTQSKQPHHNSWVQITKKPNQNKQIVGQLVNIFKQIVNSPFSTQKVTNAKGQLNEYYGIIFSRFSIIRIPGGLAKSPEKFKSTKIQFTETGFLLKSRPWAKNFKENIANHENQKY